MGLKGVANVGGGTIGGPVIGGTATRVLFVGAGGVLADSANLTFAPTGSLLTLGTDVVVSRYAAKQVMISGDGTGATTNAGLIIGYHGVNGWGAVWPSNVTPSTTNYAFAASGGSTELNATSSLSLTISGSARMAIASTAGAGPAITAGTAADNAPRALSISQTWTDGTSSNIGIVGNFDMGATGTATGKLLSLQAGAAGTTEVFSVSQSGTTTIAGDAAVTGTITGGNIYAGADLRAVSTGSIYWNSRSQMQSPSDGVVLMANLAVTDFSRLQFGGTTSSFPAIKRSTTSLETKLADDSAYTNHTALTFTTSAANTPWTLGAANVVSPASPNRTITISIGGTTYYLHAKTTND